MSSTERHLTRMAAAARDNKEYRDHWTGNSGAAYLSGDAAEALDGKLGKLSVNFVRLAVSALSDRLTLRGFTRPTQKEIDTELLELAAAADLGAKSKTLHADRLLYGSAYCTVWTTADGRQPVLITDTGENTSVVSDPATGEAESAMRLWRTGDTAHAVLFTPETVTRLQADVMRGATVHPSTQWSTVQRWDNALETVPVVPFIRRTSSLDVHGVSAVADILGLSDALAKALADAMVNSEYYARPRRWATGLEIVEDENGKPIDPFGNKRLLQSEDPETKFGQLAPAAPGQAELIATLTQQIGALTGLPAHYLGLHGDQPPSAESVRAAEAQLVTMARTEMKYLATPWAKVAGLLRAVGTEQHPADRTYVTHWEDPETSTPAQAADAAGKLRDIGVPLSTLLSDPLGYPAELIPEIVSEANRERLIANTVLGRGNG